MNELGRKRVFLGRWKGAYSGRIFRGTPCFCFSLQERERGRGGFARWLPIGSSYPLDDVLPGAAEHTALKEPFFQRKGKSSTRSDPHSLPKHPPPPPPPPCAADPQLLPACFPLAGLQVLHVAATGAGWRWAPPPLCPQKTLVFQWDEGVLVLAGWSRGVEGVERMGVRGGQPPGRAGNKRTSALSHALLFWKHSCAPVEVETDEIIQFKSELNIRHATCNQTPKNERCIHHLGIGIMMSNQPSPAYR